MTMHMMFTLRQADAERFNRGQTVQARINGEVADVWLDGLSGTVSCRRPGKEVERGRLVQVTPIQNLCSAPDEFLDAFAKVQGDDSAAAGQLFVCE
jgi:hypothetical protein